MGRDYQAMLRLRLFREIFFASGGFILNGKDIQFDLNIFHVLRSKLFSKNGAYSFTFQGKFRSNIEKQYVGFFFMVFEEIS